MSKSEPLIKLIFVIKMIEALRASLKVVVIMSILLIRFFLNGYESVLCNLFNRLIKNMDDSFQ